MADEVTLVIPEVIVEVTTTDPPVVQLTTSPSLPQFDALPDVDTTARIDKSLLYYDAASAQFRADATITTTTLTDGGNY
jgi:hypothetical protein